MRSIIGAGPRRAQGGAGLGAGGGSVCRGDACRCRLEALQLYSCDEYNVNFRAAHTLAYSTVWRLDLVDLSQVWRVRSTAVQLYVCRHIYRRPPGRTVLHTTAVRARGARARPASWVRAGIARSVLVNESVPTEKGGVVGEQERLQHLASRTQPRATAFQSGDRAAIGTCYGNRAYCRLRAM